MEPFKDAVPPTTDWKNSPGTRISPKKNRHSHPNPFMTRIEMAKQKKTYEEKKTEFEKIWTELTKKESEFDETISLLLYEWALLHYAKVIDNHDGFDICLKVSLVSLFLLLDSETKKRIREFPIKETVFSDLHQMPESFIEDMLSLFSSTLGKEILTESIRSFSEQKQYRLTKICIHLFYSFMNLEKYFDPKLFSQPILPNDLSFKNNLDFLKNLHSVVIEFFKKNTQKYPLEYQEFLYDTTIVVYLIEHPGKIEEAIQEHQKKVLTEEILLSSDIAHLELRKRCCNLYASELFHYINDTKNLALQPQMLKWSSKRDQIAKKIPKKENVAFNDANHSSNAAFTILLQVSKGETLPKEDYEKALEKNKIAMKHIEENMVQTGIFHDYSFNWMQTQINILTSLLPFVDLEQKNIYMQEIKKWSALILEKVPDTAKEYHQEKLKKIDEKLKDMDLNKS